jgi:hypothetical protein
MFFRDGGCFVAGGSTAALEGDRRAAAAKSGKNRDIVNFMNFAPPQCRILRPIGRKAVEGRRCEG